MKIDINTILITILIIIISYIYFNNEKINRISNIEINRDTIRELIIKKPIAINKKKARLETISDSIISAKPFIARIDTIINHDTIMAEYKFPDSTFNISISQKPDTNIKINSDIFRFSQKEEESTFSKITNYIIAGGIGAIIGILINHK